MAKRRRTAQTLQGYEYATISAEIAAAAAAAAAAFTDLIDVPVTYVGQSLKAVRVNAGETGLEFYTPTGGAAAFTDLTDVPTSYSGEGGRLVMVSYGETALEFVDPPSTGLTQPQIMARSLGC